MDDFNVSSLHESRNEWASRLVTILTPAIIDGYKSIFDEAIKLCRENNEMDKYLMTFQNFISRIPKWNPTIIETEKKRICEKSGCVYLEDLITCVHIIQLKILTAMRVGQKQKKIDIHIPKLDDFIHKCYIQVARKVYKNVYLFEISIPPLQVQKHNRELEIIIQEAILNTLREGIPVETILKAYLDETVEEDVIEEIKEQMIEETKKEEISSLQQMNNNSNNSSNSNNSNINDNNNIIQTNNNNSQKLSFNNIDYVRDENNNISNINAPKSIERLEEISEMRNIQRKRDSEEEESENMKLNITGDTVELGDLDIHVIDEPKLNLLPDLLIDDIEILE
jgi:hypothetical protein